MAKTLDEAGVKRLIQEIKGANKNLNTPIPISTENTPESKAQNVKNIADYVEKAKAAGIANVDGRGVTCLINGGISGLGYISVTGNSFDLIGMMMWDDMVDNAFFMVSGGEFNSRKIAFEGTVDTVTSDMLVKGARKPIILTPSTREVDEETYQKLLSDDVDVVFKTNDNKYLPFQRKIKNENDCYLYFSSIIFEADVFDAPDSNINSVLVGVKTKGPHEVTLEVSSDDLNGFLLNSGYINKSTLNPVLQEIDLSGTDADRKAKLDKFKADWKKLTGVSDWTGARFVGYLNNSSGNTNSADYFGVFTYDVANAGYFSICSNINDNLLALLTIDEETGAIYITPLFSHLEAITIYTDNTPEHMQANLDNIAAYEANLQALGVTNVDGIMIPIKFEDDPENIAITFPFSGYITKYSNFYDGIVSTLNGAYNPRVITINGQQEEDGGKVVFETIALENQLDNYTPKFLNTKSLEAITIKTGNTPDDKAANVAAIKDYVNNLTALGVDVTKGYMIPITDGTYQGILMSLDSRKKRYRGQLYKDDEHYYPLYIEEDGTIHVSDIFISYTVNLSTTSKQIVGAINEVNANAVHSDKLVPTLEAITIETNNSTENKAANKAAIEAYRDKLTALGVDTTKGYMIPITDGTYQGILMSLDSRKKRYRGQLYKDDEHYYPLYIEEDGTIHVSDIFISYTVNLSTTSKQVVGAINEVNDLAKGYSTIFKPIELTTETAQNKTAIDARVAAFTAQGISLTNGCCIPVTYKGVYAGNISLINGDWYGLLVKNTNNPADNINIKLSADGTITEGNSAQ